MELKDHLCIIHNILHAFDLYTSPFRASYPEYLPTIARISLNEETFLEMASSLISLDQVRSLLECPVCLCVYKDPRLLPCHHTFCAKPCVENLINTSTNTLSCPLCRLEHQVPEHGVSGYSSNTILIPLLALSGGGSSTEDAEDSACVICQARDVIVVFCGHCSKKICCECEKRHLQELRGDVKQLLLQLCKQTEHLLAELPCADETSKYTEEHIKTMREMVNGTFSDIKSRLKQRHKALDAILDGVVLKSRKKYQNISTTRERLISCLDQSIKKK